jgi:hypothetical protein
MAEDPLARNRGRVMSHEDDAAEYFETRSKKGRGMATASLELIEIMHKAAKAAQPITGRGIGYKLFALDLISSMKEMPKVYRLLRIAREKQIIPWEWIVDETRELERAGSWDDPAAFVRTVRRAYRRDFWKLQPKRVEVWSEKGTVRGVLAPVLNEYGVGFRVLHGFNSATGVYDVASDGDERKLSVIYVGDYDPSGMYMSEKDLPQRLERYGGSHIEITRLAIMEADVPYLSTFHVSEKKKDPRYSWFVKHYGKLCCELDAMDPNMLRDLVEEAIKDEIEPEAWERCEKCQKAEQESLQTVLDAWSGGSE